MKDNYNFPRGTYPAELFDKIDGLADLNEVSRLLSAMAPTEMWEHARRCFLNAVFEYVFLYVPEEHRNMEAVKELIQMEYDGKLCDFFERISDAGELSQPCSEYGIYKGMPSEVREAVLTEVVYSIGLNTEMNTRGGSVLVMP